MPLNINSWLPKVSALGPGARAVVWLQGCDQNCDGCISPEMRPERQETLVEPGELANELMKISGIEGVTVSGGEPLLQAGPLREFLRLLKENGNLNTMVYSGYPIEEIGADPVKRECLRYIDLLVDGPYDKALPQGLWRGSVNQRLLSPTGYFSREQLQLWGDQSENRVEVHLVKNRVVIVGIPSREFLEEFRMGLDQRGIFFDQGDCHE